MRERGERDGVMGVRDGEDRGRERMRDCGEGRERETDRQRQRKLSCPPRSHACSKTCSYALLTRSEGQ